MKTLVFHLQLLCLRYWIMIKDTKTNIIINFLCNKWVAWPHEGKLLIYTSWAGEHLHFRIKGLIYLIPETSISCFLQSLFMRLTWVVMYWLVNIYALRFVLVKEIDFDRTKKTEKRRYLSEGRLLSYKIYYHLNQKPHEVRWIIKRG